MYSFCRFTGTVVGQDPGPVLCFRILWSGPFGRVKGTPLFVTYRVLPKLHNCDSRDDGIPTSGFSLDLSFFLFWDRISPLIARPSPLRSSGSEDLPSLRPLTVKLTGDAGRSV